VVRYSPCCTKRPAPSSSWSPIPAAVAVAVIAELAELHVGYRSTTRGGRCPARGERFAGGGDQLDALDRGACGGGAGDQLEALDRGACGGGTSDQLEALDRGAHRAPARPWRGRGARVRRARGPLSARAVRGVHVAPCRASRAGSSSGWPPSRTGRGARAGSRSRGSKGEGRCNPVAQLLRPLTLVFWSCASTKPDPASGSPSSLERAHPPHR